MTASKAQVISANDLLDGDVVYLDADGGWTRALSEASLITDNALADALLDQAKAQPGRIIDPYSLDVTVGPDRVTPAHIRERLRDSGPSIRPDLQRVPWQPKD